MHKKQAPYLSVEQVNQLRNHSDYKIIDVRTEREFQQVHIPEAHNIPLNELMHRADELRDSKQTLILHCRTTNRSDLARQILQSLGIENTTVMTGGIQEWQQQQFEVVRGKPSQSFLSALGFALNNRSKTL